MPLNPAGLQSDFEDLFSDPPGTVSECAQAWADAVQAYFAGVVPSSTTVTAAAATLKTALESVFNAGAASDPSTAASSMETAFAAFATTVAGGMAPAFVATPPTGQIGFKGVLGSLAAKGTATATGTTGDLPAGATVVRQADGAVYTVDSEVTNITTARTVSLTAVVAGTAGTISPGDDLEIDPPIGGVDTQLTSPQSTQAGAETGNNKATHAEAASDWKDAIDAWAKTGMATPSGGGLPVNWS